jgi:hypothetical protein
MTDLTHGKATDRGLPQIAHGLTSSGLRIPKLIAKITPGGW